MTWLLSIALLFVSMTSPAPYIVTASGYYGATAGGSLPLMQGGESVYKVYTANNYFTKSAITAKWSAACHRGGLSIRTDEIAVDGGAVIVSFMYRGKFVSAYLVELAEFSTVIIPAPIYTAVIISNAADVEILRTNRTVVYFSGLECAR